MANGRRTAQGAGPLGMRCEPTRAWGSCPSASATEDEGSVVGYRLRNPGARKRSGSTPSSSANGACRRVDAEPVANRWSPQGEKFDSSTLRRCTLRDVPYDGLDPRTPRRFTSPWRSSFVASHAAHELEHPSAFVPKLFDRHAPPCRHLLVGGRIARVAVPAMFVTRTVVARRRVAGARANGNGGSSSSMGSTGPIRTDTVRGLNAFPLPVGIPCRAARESRTPRCAFAPTFSASWLCRSPTAAFRAAVPTRDNRLQRPAARSRWSPAYARSDSNGQAGEFEAPRSTSCSHSRAFDAKPSETRLVGLVATAAEATASGSRR